MHSQWIFPANNDAEILHLFQLLNKLKSAEHKNDSRNSTPCSMCNYLSNLSERKRSDLNIWL